VENLFVAGDSCGVEEASSAMVEGYLAGLTASAKIGKRHEKYDEKKADYLKQLNDLRSGPVGKHIRAGIEKIVRR